MRFLLFFLAVICAAPGLAQQQPPPAPSLPLGTSPSSSPPLVNAPGGEVGGLEGGAPYEVPYEPPLTPEQIAPLRAQIEAIEKQFKDGAVPADAQNAPLLRFKIEQARLILIYLEEGIAAVPSLAKRALEAHLARAQVVAKAKGDANYPATTPMHERAYIAANDGSVQPFWVFVPDNYSPQKKYPLIVFLHGYSPYISKVDPWLPDEATWRLATKRDCILVLPYGRRNTDFVDVGEDDTLRVLDEMKKLYPIDPQRVFLMGPSMGGFGVYAIGLHHPDRWTALSAMSARSDFYLWFGLNRESVAPWKRAQYDADNPRTLARNAARLPIFTQHGALDAIVSVEQSRRLQRDLKALNYPASYREIPEGDHYIYFGADAYDHAYDWIKTQRSAVTPPRRVVYTTGNPRNDGAHWARINAFENYAEVAQIDASIGADNTLSVTTKNVAAWTLSPPASLLKKGAKLKLKLNGVLQTTSYDAAQPVRWDKALQRGLSQPKAATPKTTAVKTKVAAQVAPPLETQNLALSTPKTPRRSGPIKNCYRDPFLLVYGTTKLPAGRINDDERMARRWAQEWEIYADGVPPIKADTQITEADRQNFNLILFGSAESNALLAPIAAQLPVEWKADGYRIGTQTFEARNHGMQLCYASPWSKERMIVVQSGIIWGAALPVNHKLDLLPDYIVFERTIDPSDKTNRALHAGFFDRFWQLPAEK